VPSCPTACCTPLYNPILSLLARSGPAGLCSKRASAELLLPRLGSVRRTQFQRDGRVVARRCFRRPCACPGRLDVGHLVAVPCWRCTCADLSGRPFGLLVRGEWEPWAWHAPCRMLVAACCGGAMRCRSPWSWNLFACCLGLSSWQQRRCIRSSGRRLIVAAAWLEAIFAGRAGVRPGCSVR
jgi:hypothetical protein